jgi:hypothetical protein
MKRFKSTFLVILGMLSILTTGIGMLAYTGPGDRSSVPGNVIKVLECGSTQYTGGPVVWRYRDWLGLSAPEGSAQALSWMATYENVDDPATPICTGGRDGVWVWQLGTGIPVSYPAATVADTLTCSVPGTNGWCRNASLKFNAVEPIPGEKITVIESMGYGNLCTINAASGSCSWSPVEGSKTTSFWSVSSFGDTSLAQSTSWKLDKTAPSLSIVVPVADGDNGWFVSEPSLSLSASDAISGIGSAIFSGGGATKVVSTEGTSSISATASDVAGNTTTKSVTVKLDTGLPNVSMPLAPNGANGWYSTRPTLTSSASDSVSGVASALVALNGGSWLTSVSPTDGTASLAGRAIDNAGNVATSAAQQVKVDTVAPAVSLSKNGVLTNGWYTTDVSITATASDATSGLSVTEYRVNGGAWTAGSVVTLSSDGSHVVDFRAIDKAGLVTQSSQTVKIDKHSPALGFTPTGTLGSNGWYTTNISLALNASDPASGVASFEYRLDGGGWISGASLTLPDGSHTVETRATDNAGNASTSTFSAKVDTGLPALAHMVAGSTGSNGWYVSDVTFTATSSDTISGLAATEYSIDGGVWKTGSVVTITSDGNHTIDFRATDNAGNRSTNTRSIKIDQTLPAVSFADPVGTNGANGWYVSPVSLTVNRSDATSGIAADEYRLNEGTWTPISTDLTLTEGVNKIDTRVTDKAGNQSSITTTIKVDLTPPSLTISVAEVVGSTGWYNTPVTLAGNPSDEGSGIAEVAYRLNNTDWILEKTVEITDDGSHSIDIRATDHAGLVALASRALKIDHTPPLSAFSIPPEGSKDTLVNGIFQFSGVSSDVMAGLSYAEYSVDNGTEWLPLYIKDGQWSFNWDTTNVRDGAYILLVRADDRAGNRENTARVMVQVSNKKPVVEVQEIWPLGQAGSIRAVPGSVPLKEGSIRIACPRHKDLFLTYSGDQIPNQLQWDRLCGDGAYAAESGDYRVTVSVCDIFDRCAQGTGLIQVPPNASLPPTLIPTPEPTSTPRATATLVPSPTPIQVIPVPSPAPVESAGAPITFPWLGLYLAVSLAIMLAFAISSVIDPRPRALMRLQKTFERLAHDG